MLDDIRCSAHFLEEAQLVIVERILDIVHLRECRQICNLFEPECTQKQIRCSVKNRTPNHLLAPHFTDQLEFEQPSNGTLCTHPTDMLHFLLCDWLLIRNDGKRLHCRRRECRLHLFGQLLHPREGVWMCRKLIATCRSSQKDSAPALRKDMFQLG